MKVVEEGGRESRERVGEVCVFEAGNVDWLRLTLYSA